MTVVKTAGMGIGGAGVIGATGYGAYTLIQPKTIGEKLVWDKVELLEENSDTWKQLIEKYNNDSQKLDETSLIKTEDTEKKKELYGKCKEFLNTPITHTETADSANITKAKRWCVKNPAVLTTGG